MIPSWLPSRPPGPTVVLDPEIAFGSGEHGSTRVALTLLERHLRPGDRVLDLGSGSGILAIAAVRLGAARAVGIEIDPEANQVAPRNAGAERRRRRVEFLEGDAADLAPLVGRPTCCSPNPAHRQHPAAAGDPPGTRRAASRSSPGMEETEGPLFRPALEAAGFAIIDEAIDTGWWAVAARRP